jgi:hypothetical protein
MKNRLDIAFFASSLVSTYWNGAATYYRGALPEEERIAIGERARRRILAEHTSMHRAEALERYTRELFEKLEIVHAPLPPDDPEMRRPVIDLAKKMLGFVPKVPLREGLTRMIAWFERVARRRSTTMSSPTLITARDASSRRLRAGGDR